jgi:cytoskeletal protein CcmA (bactofilin family)
MNSMKFKRRTAVKLFGLLAIVLVFSLAFSAPVFAGTEIEGDPDVTIGADEVIDDDVFVGGRHVLVEGTINGDLFASGETVTITGTVEGNLIATGAVVTISGTVDGTALLGCYSAEIQPGAVITRSVYFGGFNLEIQPEAMVERSIYAGGYQVQIGGQVDRGVVAGVGAFAADGTIGGDVLLDVGDPDSQFPDIQFGEPFDRYEVEMLAPGLYIEDDAIGGELDYRYSQMDVNVNTDIDVEQFTDDVVSFFVTDRLRHRTGEFVTLLLLGAALLYFGMGWLSKAVDEVKANSLRDTGVGLAIFVLFLPAILILGLALVAVVVLGSFLTFGTFTGTLMSLGWLSFSGLMAVFGLLVSYGTKIVLGYLVGRWILEKTSENGFENYWRHFAALALGVFIYEVLRAVPVFGWLLAVIVIVIGTGAIFFVLRDKFRKAPTEAAVGEA